MTATREEALKWAVENVTEWNYPHTVTCPDSDRGFHLDSMGTLCIMDLGPVFYIDWLKEKARLYDSIAPHVKLDPGSGAVIGVNKQDAEDAALWRRMQLINTKVSRRITIANLGRLINGDLEHIGDALIEGNKIEVCNFESCHHTPEKKVYTEIESDETFLLTSVNYRINQKIIIVNGVEVPAPESDEPDVGSTFYVPSAIYAASGEVLDDVWHASEEDLDLLKAGLVYLNKEDAVARAEAMLKFQVKE